MKSVTAREFYHNVGVVDGLPEGRQLMVTAKGKPKFMVTRSVRRRMTRALAEECAAGDPQEPVFDGTAFLRGPIHNYGHVRGKEFLAQARRERRAYPPGVCKKRATPPAPKRTAALRVAPNWA